jgi:hypothetical protein
MDKRFASGQFGVNLASNDVPNSLTSELKLDAASKIYGDAYIAGQKVMVE